MNKIVIDTSPLIVLFKTQLAYLLPRLFTEIVVPSGVWTEVVDAEKNDLASKQLPTVSWVEQTDVSNISPLISSWGLDLGESEVLSFALQNNSYRAIIDDAAARRVAKTLNISFMGTLGIILLAKKRGLIPSISEPISAIQNAGLWMGEDLIQFLKQQAGE